MYVWFTMYDGCLDTKLYYILYMHVFTTKWMSLCLNFDLAAVDHASAPSFKSKSETSQDQTSTGKDFQPASWKPWQQRTYIIYVHIIIYYTKYRDAHLCNIIIVLWYNIIVTRVRCELYYAVRSQCDHKLHLVIINLLDSIMCIHSYFYIICYSHYFLYSTVHRSVRM